MYSVLRLLFLPHSLSFILIGVSSLDFIFINPFLHSLQSLIPHDHILEVGSHPFIHLSVGIFSLLVIFYIFYFTIFTTSCYHLNMFISSSFKNKNTALFSPSIFSSYSRCHSFFSHFQSCFYAATSIRFILCAWQYPRCLCYISEQNRLLKAWLL